MTDIEKYLQDSASLLRRMVSIPSLSFEEENVRDEISRTLHSWGVEHRIIKNNIIAVHKSQCSDAPTLMMDAHIDTVPACSGYSFDPFNPDYGVAANAIFGHEMPEDQFICGLGSNDDGGSVAAMTATFRYYLDKELPFNLILTLSCEEERSGSDGTRFLYSGNGPFGDNPSPEYAGIPKPDWAIVGEPTSCRAATSERGLLVIDGTAHGVSGHAGRGEGVNALYIALDDITKLRGYEFSKVSEMMGKVRMTVTQIQAGTAHNVVPDSCSFVVDIRPTDSYSNPEILALLQGMCKSSLKARNLLNESSATRPGSILAECAEKVGLETFSSPTTSDWMRMNCDAVKLGPGDSSRSHKKDEYILISEIRQAIGIYIRFIEEMAKALQSLF